MEALRLTQCSQKEACRLSPLTCSLQPTVHCTWLQDQKASLNAEVSIFFKNIYLTYHYFYSYIFHTLGSGGTEQEIAEIRESNPFYVLEILATGNLNPPRHRFYLIDGNYSIRVGTPFQKLWYTQEDRALIITTMGFDVETFRKLLEGSEGFGECWENGNPSKWREHCRRWLDGGSGALCLILHWDCQNMFGIV